MIENDEVTETNVSGNVQIAARVPAEAHAEFFAKAEELGMSASAIMRELIIGFTEGRVSIIAPVRVNKLYVQEDSK